MSSGGGVFSFGQAPFEGSAGAITLSQPIVGQAATPDGGGYWLAAKDGGIFSYGSATYWGSLPGEQRPRVEHRGHRAHGRRWRVLARRVGRRRLQPSVTPATSARSRARRPRVGHRGHRAHGRRWRLLAGGQDGGVFAFGDAVYAGSLPGNMSQRARTSWASPRRRTVAATGWWARTVGSSPSVTPPTPGRSRATKRPRVEHRGHRRPTRRWRVLAGGDRRRDLRLRFGARFLGSLPGLNIHVSNVVGITSTP